MGVLVLTGGPAAGKNTTAKALANTRERCAVIDVDDVRWMVLQPHAAPWEGDEGLLQQELGVKNACILAENFIEAGYDVLILDVLTEETAEAYRRKLASHHPTVVLLNATFEEAQRRADNRPPVLGQAKFKSLHEQQRVFSAYDVKIDTTNMSPSAVAGELGRFL